MQEQVTIMAVKEKQLISKKTGKPFTMYSALVGENRWISGFGAVEKGHTYDMNIVTTQKGSYTNHNYEIMADVTGTEDQKKPADESWVPDGMKVVGKNPAPKTPESNSPEKPNWDEINLGKCRHTLYCAVVENGVSPIDLLADDTMLSAIEELAKRSMGGRFADERVDDDEIPM